MELQLPAHGASIGKSLVNLQLPKTSLIVLIDRGGKFVTPNGATMLEPHDKLMVMVDSEEELQRVKAILLG
ncbi:hypothetical protein GCM10028895_14610 [Pontibacter rugosus]